MRKDFCEVKKLVVKVGSSLLVDEQGNVMQSWMKKLMKDVANLRIRGVEVVIVTSGSVAIGKTILMQNYLNSVTKKQVASALGQIELMTRYRNLAKKEGFEIAQILLNSSDCSDRHRYINLQNVFLQLLKSGITPIVNENDSISVEEIKIGDNDRLAARVAQIISADMLILLSDIDGLYDKNPRISKDSKFLPVVEKITKEIESMAQKTTSKVGTGGMVTKIAAAKMADISGCDTVITSGLENGCLSKLFYGNKKRYTIFRSRNYSVKLRKKRFSGFLNSKGEAIINKDAAQILVEKNVSLLPVGVVKINGSFKKGDLIFIKDENGNHIASGIANYGSVTARRVMGKRSDVARQIAKKISRAELVHIDNLLMMND